ncbi:MAG: hypothetical protein WDW36_004461 [Sanguina aurantia]
MADNKVAVGLVIGLDYTNPHLNTFQEFQQWKLHPLVQQHLKGGTCLQYGARSLNEGGMQSIPKLTFPGGALVGCAAGFLNVPKIKGTHTAMFSGMLAAESTVRALEAEEKEAKEAAVAAAAAAAEAAGVVAVATSPVATATPVVIAGTAETVAAVVATAAPFSPSVQTPLLIDKYEAAIRNSWLWEELSAVRNVRPAFRYGLLVGMVNAALEGFLIRGRAPWTLHHRFKDHEVLTPAKTSPVKAYPPPDNVTTFDIPTSLHRSGTTHEHDQPSHLKLLDPGLPERFNDPHYAGPETRYCPAGVYEYDTTPHGRRRLLIHAQNCLHCKACDIKDPSQNIKWVAPEGGGGPRYTVM